MRRRFSICFYATRFQGTSPIWETPGLTASSHVLVSSDALALSDLHARGGDMAIDGVYVTKRNQRRAAFVVEKGIVSAGIELVNDEGPPVRLFGLDDWYRGKVQRGDEASRGRSSPRWVLCLRLGKRGSIRLSDPPRD